MSEPKRIQMTRQKPWRCDNPDAVIVARPSKWGNPFKIENAMESGYAQTKEAAAALCVSAFDNWLHGSENHLQGQHALRLKMNNEIVPELRGKDLACWCPLDQPCHADVLLKLANRPTKSEG